MKDKTKVWLISGVLLVASVFLMAGIVAVLYKEPVKESNPNDGSVNASEEVSTEIEFDREQATVVCESTEGTQITPEEFGTVTVSDVLPKEEEQKIQDDPEIPEAPSQTPELKEGEDVHDPGKTPEYVEQKPEQKPEGTPTVTVPDNNKGHEGEIYLEGFGWIKSNGVPNQTIYAPEMYLSGEKVGDM